MSRYVANMTSTHNGKVLIAGESFDPVEKGFKDIDINCLLNNGRIRVDFSNETFPVHKNEPDVKKESVKEEPVEVKEELDDFIDGNEPEFFDEVETNDPTENFDEGLFDEVETNTPVVDEIKDEKEEVKNTSNSSKKKKK